MLNRMIGLVSALLFLGLASFAHAQTMPMIPDELKEPQYMGSIVCANEQHARSVFQTVKELNLQGQQTPDAMGRILAGLLVPMLSGNCALDPTFTKSKGSGKILASVTKGLFEFKLAEVPGVDAGSPKRFAVHAILALPNPDRQEA